jgi:hypothetical protein
MATTVALAGGDGVLNLLGAVEAADGGDGISTTLYVASARSSCSRWGWNKEEKALDWTWL